MKNSGNLQLLTVRAQSLLTSSEPEEFQRERFYVTAPTPYMVSISGSTEAHLHEEETKQVLDASAIKSDSFSRMMMAIADGLGDSEERADNANNANISAYCCDTICQLIFEKKTKENSLLRDLKILAAKSKSMNKTSSMGLDYDGRTAISAIDYSHQAHEAYVASIGDTLTVVFDGKTGAVKYQQEARVYNQGGAIWAPVDLQMLAHKNAGASKFAQSALQMAIVPIERDDIVVQMSDGIWSQFKTKDHEVKLEKTAYIGTRLDINNIQELCDRLTQKTLGTLSALDITAALHQSAMAIHLSNVTIFQQIHPEVSAKLSLETSPIKTMRAFIVDLEPRTAELFRQLFVAQKHDFIMYDDDLPVVAFRQQYQKICFGDCATISVLKAPGEYDEVFYRLLSIKDFNQSELRDFQTLARLSVEEIISLCIKFRTYKTNDNGEPFAMEIGTPLVEEKIIDKLQSFLVHFKSLQEIVDSKKPMVEKRSQIIEYLNEIDDPEACKSLAKFFHKFNSSFFKGCSFTFFTKATPEEMTAADFDQKLSLLAKNELS